MLNRANPTDRAAFDVLTPFADLVKEDGQVAGATVLPTERPQA
jgi:hypothetical protein